MNDIPLKVEFRTHSPRYDSVCSACHVKGPVVAILLPETKYFQQGKLKTIHRCYWLCKKCRKKLIKALKRG